MFETAGVQIFSQVTLFRSPSQNKVCAVSASAREGYEAVAICMLRRNGRLHLDPGISRK